MGRQAKREVRQKVVRRSYTHRNSSRSFVPSFYSCSSCSPSSRPIPSSSFIAVPQLPPSTFLHEECAILKLRFTNRIILRTLDISNYHSRNLDLLDCFFDFELISRAKLLLRSHKRAWPRIEWLVMGVNYVQLYCVCAHRIY